MNAAKLAAVIVALGALGYGSYVAYKDNTRPLSPNEEREIEAELEFLRQRIEEHVALGKFNLSADEAWLLDRVKRLDWKNERLAMRTAMRKLHDRVYNIKK